jgi:hypothetical protein
MRYRDVERALLANGCKWQQGKGDHEKWYCPCGRHIAVVTQARTSHPAWSPTRSISSPASRRAGFIDRAGDGTGSELATRNGTKRKNHTGRRSMTYTVLARRWKHGWELHIDGVGVTQSRTLDTAEQMVRDYIETLADKDVSGDTIVITPELGDLDRKVTNVRAALAAADRQQQEASKAYRALAADLRAAGLSVSDTAAILGVSRGRVSQLSRAS